MPPRVAGLTGATLQTAPTVCHDCVWWQSRAGRTAQGALDREGRGRLGRLGDALRRRRRPAARVDAVRAGGLFPRAAELPAGPPSRRRRARHVRLPRRPVEAVGDAVAVPDRDRRGAGPRRGGAGDVRLPLPEGESTYERFQVHKTVFPRDFLADFGFRTLRSRRAASSSSGSSSAGCSRCWRAAAPRCCRLREVFAPASRRPCPRP